MYLERLGSGHGDLEHDMFSSGSEGKAKIFRLARRASFGSLLPETTSAQVGLFQIPPNSAVICGA